MICASMCARLCVCESVFLVMDDGVIRMLLFLFIYFFPFLLKVATETAKLSHIAGANPNAHYA